MNGDMGGMNECEEARARRDALVTDLASHMRNHGRMAFLCEGYSAACFYGSLLFAAIAFVSGFVKTVQVPPELISVSAAIASGLTILARRARFRDKADWHYSIRDTAEQISNELRFELPFPITRDSVAQRSEAWRARRAKLGLVMQAIHGAEGEIPATIECAAAERDRPPSGASSRT